MHPLSHSLSLSLSPSLFLSLFWKFAVPCVFVQQLLDPWRLTTLRPMALAKGWAKGSWQLQPRGSGGRLRKVVPGCPGILSMAPLAPMASGFRPGFRPEPELWWTEVHPGPPRGAIAPDGLVSRGRAARSMGKRSKLRFVGAIWHPSALTCLEHPGEWSLFAPLHYYLRGYYTRPRLTLCSSS